MGYAICIGSQKGGVGKTTTAICLSSALAIAEKKTLLVDADPQGHATTGMGVNKNRITKNLHHGLIGESPIEDVIVDSDIDSLKIIPANIDLFRTESEIYSKSGKEGLLKELIINKKDEFDYIIIDSPPSLNLLTVNAFTAADTLIIPVHCEPYALESLGQLLRILHILKNNFNPDLRVAGILLTMFDKNEGLSTRIANSIRTRFKDMVFKTIIPKDMDLRESACYGKPALLHDIHSVGARSYLDLANEIFNS